MGLLKKYFWLFFSVLLALALLLVLWTGRQEVGSYGDFACTFENQVPGCLASNEEWNSGIAFYDSTLAATGDTLGSLKSLLWNHWNLEFAGAGEAAVSQEAVLPLRVLKTRKSGCVGLSWLAMMVAESRQIPLRVVLLPGHVFLKYDCGSENLGRCVNLEPNRQGFSYTDEEYREKYKNGQWTGLELKPLSSRQFVGLAAFDIGNLYLKTDPHHALTWYRMAEDFFGEYPGISVNQGIAKRNLPNLP